VRGDSGDAWRQELMPTSCKRPAARPTQRRLTSDTDRARRWTKAASTQRPKRRPAPLDLSASMARRTMSAAPHSDTTSATWQGATRAGRRALLWDAFSG
jgi:hypothetical protein